MKPTRPRLHILAALPTATSRGCRSPRLCLCAAAIAFAACAFASGAQPAVDSQDPIRDTRDALEKWIETRRTISKERQDWAVAREMLEQRIALVRREIESLQERIAEAQDDVEKAEARRAELDAENTRLKNASSVLSDTVATLEERTRGLLARLPEPLREEVRPLSQRLPESPGATDLSLGGRYQNVIGILNQANKFNSELTLTSEVRQLSADRSMEVAVVYIGLGQAYYVNTRRDVAGVGTGADDAWVWQPASDAAADIARAIDIMENKEVASFVKLPADIR